MSIDVNNVIEEEKLSPLQLFVLILVSSAIIADGFDIQIIAFVSPVLIEEWNITRGDLAPAISAALLGMALGAPIGGRLGDTLGRRLAIVLSTLFFGITTLPVAFVENVWQLTLMRFITGLGFGALLPNATAMIAEWMPSRIRSYAISLMIIGVPLGGMVGAAISSWLIDDFGWRTCFVIGGLFGIVLSVVLFYKLPESPKYLVKNSEQGRAVVPLLNRAFPQRQFTETAIYSVNEPQKSRWSDIFAPQLLRVTLGLAVAFFTSLLVFYGFANWIPSILTSLGFPLETALKGAMLFNLCGLAGAIAVAALVSKMGSKTGLILVLSGALVATAIMGVTLNSNRLDTSTLFLTLSLCGGLLAGLQVGLYTLAAGAYPTNSRSSGVGFVAGLGRLGPIASAYGGGLILDTAKGNTIFFVALILVLIIAVAGVLLVNRHTQPAKKPTNAPPSKS